MSEEQSVEEAVSELRYLLTNTEYESSLDLLRERLEEVREERDRLRDPDEEA